jgi:hypothetical protein
MEGFSILLFCLYLCLTSEVSGRGIGHVGGEHLQDFPVSGFQGKNLFTDQACQAEAVNLSIAFGPRPHAQCPSLKLQKS